MVIITVDRVGRGNVSILSWWRHQMETFSALLAICAGNSPVPGELPAQRPVTRSFDVFFYLRPNKRLSKQWWGWWFETLSCSLWRHCHVLHKINVTMLLIMPQPCPTYNKEKMWILRRHQRNPFSQTVGDLWHEVQSSQHGIEIV